MGVSGVRECCVEPIMWVLFIDETLDVESMVLSTKLAINQATHFPQFRLFTSADY